MSVMVTEQVLSAFCIPETGLYILQWVPLSPLHLRETESLGQSHIALVSRAMKICEFLPVTLRSHYGLWTVLCKMHGFGGLAPKSCSLESALFLDFEDSLISLRLLIFNPV